jgi:8-amino-7-oxononanoate synthase
MTILAKVKERLGKRGLLFRSLPETRGVDFSSNDYLGLSWHPEIKARAIQYIKKYGVGSRASRLITGSLPCFSQVEIKLAEFKRTEAALLFSTGYQANLSLLSCLADEKTSVFADRLCHNSLLMGIKLSGAHLFRYRHQDMDHLDALLKKSTNSSNMIVTETVFSMDGDRCPMEPLQELRNRYRAFLYVDESHATGVQGKEGRGLATGNDADVIMGTFGKALGSFGAYVACSSLLKDYIINFAGGFIYTTALPPAVIGAIDAALDLIPGMEKERLLLKKRSDNFRVKLAKLGFSCGQSDTNIIPIILGEEERTTTLSRSLLDKGFIVIPIRPPTVPKGQARLRIALSVKHTEEQIERLLKACQ